MGQAEVKRWIEVWEDDLGVSCQVLSAVRVKHEEVDSVVVEQLNVLWVLLLVCGYVNIRA